MDNTTKMDNTTFLRFLRRSISEFALQNKNVFSSKNLHVLGSKNLLLKLIKCFNPLKMQLG